MTSSNIYPVVALRDQVVLPSASVRLIIGRRASLRAVSAALEGDKHIVLFVQRDGAVEDPALEDLHPVGVLARVNQATVLPDGNQRVVLQGVRRVTLGSVLRTEPCWLIQPVDFEEEDARDDDAVPPLSEIKEAIAALNQYQPGLIPALAAYKQTPTQQVDSEHSTDSIDVWHYSDWTYWNLGTALTSADVFIGDTCGPGQVADILTVCADIPRADKLRCLLEANTAQRLRATYDSIVATRRRIQWDRELQTKVTLAVKDQHRELFLREKLRVVLDELGESALVVLHNPVFRGRGFKRDESLAFVLMPFTDRFRPVFENIVKPVIERFGLRGVRADDIYGPRPIMEDVWRSINEAQVIIADVTGKNPNVFYEVGLAHAIGKDVIIISQSLEDIPFDLRHLRCIIYLDSVAGFKQFERRLDDTLAAMNGLTRVQPVS
jgi:Lon protease-like protein